MTQRMNTSRMDCGFISCSGEADEIGVGSELTLKTVTISDQYGAPIRDREHGDGSGEGRGGGGGE